MGCLALPHPFPEAQVVNPDLCSHEAPEGAEIPEESCSVGCDSEEETHTSCSRDLIDRISKGLLVPSKPLSAAAARKLVQRAPHSSRYTGHRSTCSSHDRHGTSATRSTARIATFGPPATAGETDTRTSEPVLLKSLPTELLYDDTGLQLFDQITYLPEYYLTAAEIDILSNFGPEIVGQCVGEGTSVTELGAGSMRKTKLLLDAVVAAGTRDVTFFALDLCEDSLIHALEQLQDHFGSQIRLAGLVGTYQQGLAYIQQQQQVSGGSSGSMSPSASFHASSSFEVAMIYLAASGAAATAAAADAASAAAAVEQQSGSSSRHLAPAGPDEDHTDQSDQSSESSGPQGSAADDSSLEQDNFDHKTASGGSTLSTDDVAGLLTDLDVTSSSCSGSSRARCATEGHENGDCKDGMAGSTASGSSGPGKLIMWLGSSIGNYSREEAAAFLTQLRELAMLPGDLLLVGIDRRNNPDKVATAYNDPSGVTNAFVMNGLQHCKHILDAELWASTAQNAEGSNTDRNKPHGVSSRPGLHRKSNQSIRPEDFEYFCLYNDELGRHEAYYLATRETQITVPVTAGAMPAAQLHAAVDCARCTVDIAAGELIHIEYSYKYSQQDVEDLADKVGLKWVKAWTDSQQQYDLHLFSRGDGVK